VNVYRARNLQARTDIVDTPCEGGTAIICTSSLSTAPYIRVTLCKAEKKLKRRRTQTRKNTLHPVYNEPLVFDVAKASLVDLALEFEVDTFRQNGG
jgi:hypothetical protein